MLLQLYFTKSKCREWQKACLSTGAQSTVIGTQRAIAYCRFIKSKFKLTNSKHRLSFDEYLQLSTGSINIQILLLNLMIICKNVRVSNENVPFLVRPDLLDKNKIVVNKIHGI